MWLAQVIRIHMPTSSQSRHLGYMLMNKEQSYKKSLILKMKLNDKRWFQNTWGLLLLFITQEQILKLDETTSSFKGEKKNPLAVVCATVGPYTEQGTRFLRRNSLKL